MTTRRAEPKAKATAKTAAATTAKAHAGVLPPHSTSLRVRTTSLGGYEKFCGGQVVGGGERFGAFVRDSASDGGNRILVKEGVAMQCTHMNHVHKVKPSAKGCEDCLKIGSTWVHLRMCMECGHVGCCDSSPNKHATKHFHTTKHPIMRSIEPRESWGWCYVDEVELDVAWPS
jgi:hypothetical protein